MFKLAEGMLVSRLPTTTDDYDSKQQGVGVVLSQKDEQILRDRLAKLFDETGSFDAKGDAGAGKSSRVFTSIEFPQLAERLFNRPFFHNEDEFKKWARKFLLDALNYFFEGKREFTLPCWIVNLLPRNFDKDKNVVIIQLLFHAYATFISEHISPLVHEEFDYFAAQRLNDFVMFLNEFFNYPNVEKVVKNNVNKDKSMAEQMMAGFEEQFAKFLQSEGYKLSKQMTANQPSYVDPRSIISIIRKEVNRLRGENNRKAADSIAKRLKQVMEDLNSKMKNHQNEKGYKKSVAMLIYAREVFLQMITTLKTADSKAYRCVLVFAVNQRLLVREQGQGKTLTQTFIRIAEPLSCFSEEAKKYYKFAPNETDILLKQDQTFQLLLLKNENDDYLRRKSHPLQGIQIAKEIKETTEAELKKEAIDGKVATILNEKRHHRDNYDALHQILMKMKKKNDTYLSSHAHGQKNYEDYSKKLKFYQRNHKNVETAFTIQTIFEGAFSEKATLEDMVKAVHAIHDMIPTMRKKDSGFGRFVRFVSGESIGGSKLYRGMSKLHRGIHSALNTQIAPKYVSQDGIVEPATTNPLIEAKKLENSSAGVHQLPFANQLEKAAPPYLEVGAKETFRKKRTAAAEALKELSNKFNGAKKTVGKGTLPFKLNELVDQLNRGVNLLAPTDVSEVLPTLVQIESAVVSRLRKIAEELNVFASCKEKEEKAVQALAEVYIEKQQEKQLPITLQPGDLLRGTGKLLSLEEAKELALQEKESLETKLEQCKDITTTWALEQKNRLEKVSERVKIFSEAEEAFQQMQTFTELKPAALEKEDLKKLPKAAKLLQEFALNLASTGIGKSPQEDIVIIEDAQSCLTTKPVVIPNGLEGDQIEPDDLKPGDSRSSFADRVKQTQDETKAFEERRKQDAKATVPGLLEGSIFKPIPLVDAQQPASPLDDKEDDTDSVRSEREVEKVSFLRQTSG